MDGALGYEPRGVQVRLLSGVHDTVASVDNASGLIWWSTRAATVGLVVEAGIIVDCPPYARRWAMGRDARQLWRDGTRRGVNLAWIPRT